MAEPEQIDEVETEEARQPFSEHLRELRTRMIYATGIIIAGFGISWGFHQELFDWLMEPYISGMAEKFPELPEVISFRSPIEPIITYLKTALLIGAIGTMPFILLQAWLFVAPGLYKHERKLAMPFLIFSYVFFVGGAVFCRYLVLAPAIEVLLGMGATNTVPNIMMQEYFAFTSKMLLVFGFLFELPVAISFLSMVGLVSHRGLIRNWRYAFVAAFVVGAMLTPPDPLTQSALAVPLVFLYALSIALAYFITKSREAGKGDTDEQAPEEESS